MRHLTDQEEHLSAFMDIANGLASGVLTLGVGGTWAAAKVKWGRAFSRGTPEEQDEALDLLDGHLERLRSMEEAEAMGAVDMSLDMAMASWPNDTEAALTRHLAEFLARYPEAIPEVQDLTRALSQQAEQTHSGSGHNIANVSGTVVFNYGGEAPES
ncbi:hypothetical protein [Streptomyces albidoflavus]|uniref:hypothetical protein n=1 Tax=Streptomyces albidoflavus TaxID=1886 RepID=UPI000A41D87A|nr:hypothetical protein [Streptomyces albidoflavus]